MLARPVPGPGEHAMDDAARNRRTARIERAEDARTCAAAAL